MQQSSLLPRLLWLALATACAGLAGGSLALTAWFNLHPCHLCIFQRLVYLLLAVVFLAAWWLSPRPAARGPGFLALPLAAAGLAAAIYQSWLQMQPPGSISCVAGQPGPVERLVEWLGQRLPELFLATGFCEQAELVILKLTLANWSAVFFAVCLMLGFLAWRRVPERRIF